MTRVSSPTVRSRDPRILADSGTNSFTLRNCAIPTLEPDGRHPYSADVPFPFRAPHRRPVGLVGAVVVGSVLALGVPNAGAAPEPDDDRSEALVSISAPIEVDRGHKALFGVAVRDLSTGAPLEGMRIVLQRRSGGEGGWAEVDRSITDRYGHAVLEAAVRPSTTDFRARMPRTDDYRAARSGHVTVFGK